MARYKQEEIDALREKADIVDVISHYIQVHRSGKNYKAICPFHNDHDPSLTINPEKKIYKCFVCGNGGNVFTFVQNFEKISFVEAVGRVAELSGFHLSNTYSTYEKPKDAHKEGLYKVLNEAITYTSYQLDTANASNALEYLENRGLNAEIRKTFQIGFDPNGDALSRYLLAKGYSEKELVSVNVSRMSESGIHDVFSERITFPIHDSQGNPVGFSARSMNPNNPSKYINTNETELFVKGDLVYNLHRAKIDARRLGKIYLCEGVTDVIAFYKAGIQNAVCTLGTACTQKQLALLKKSSAKLVFCYDGDMAGQRATYKAAKLARSIGCDVAIVSNKTGKDPDEIIRSYGAEGLQNLVSKEISWMEFVLQYFENSVNMDSYLEKKEMVQKVIAEINALEDESERAYFAKVLADDTGIPIHIDDKPKEETIEHIYKLVVPDGTKDAEEMILSMIMASPQASQKFEEELGYLLSEEYHRLAMLIIDANHTYGKADPNLLIDMTNEQTIKDLITKIATREDFGSAYDEAKMNGAMRKIKREVLSARAKKYRQQIAEALNHESLTLLIQQYNECLQEQRRLMNEENQQNNGNE